jgi:Flp pilus assembly protein TadG
MDKDAGLLTEAKEAGQIVVIFALMLTVLIGLLGIAIDTTYAWREALRVQRASDAAALAGVVYLPGNFAGTGGAKDTAYAAAQQNGFPSTSNTVSVTQGATPRELDVSITTQVPTFFVRIFGINTFAVTRSSKAVYVLPVPMGSPDPYYGVYGDYTMTTGTQTMKSPTGVAMGSGARGFWGTMLTQGSAAERGDAYLPENLNSDLSGTNPSHDTADYYDYTITMPPGSTGGHVWIFDPVFCDTDGRYGTGDFYLSSSSTDATVNAVNSNFLLYNTNNQPYKLSAQTLLGSTGSLFASDNFTDTTANGAATSSIKGSTSCTNPSTFATTDPRHWHNTWFDLTSYILANGGSSDAAMSGGAGGTTYRLRTTTVPAVAGSQDKVNAYNDFAIYVTSTGGSAQVSGSGAMEMYTPLPGGGTSLFYLAQIDAASGAGKTVEVDLWDVGDTNGLNASLQVLQPTTSGWSPVSMTWTGVKVATDSGAGTCPSGSGSSITTTTSSTMYYNGCWLNIAIALPTTYNAPQSGWWKIQYTMGGSSSTQATDLTTWQVNIRGNPVHLVP